MLWLLLCAVACSFVQGYTPEDVAAKDTHRRLLREDRRTNDGVEEADESQDHDGSVAALVSSDGRMNFDILNEEDDFAPLNNREQKGNSAKSDNSASTQDIYAENVCPWWFNPPITTMGDQKAMRRCYNNNFCSGESCCVTQQSNTYLCPQGAGYMCSEMDVCGTTNATSEQCDYACASTPDACSTHGGLRSCEGPPGPVGSPTNATGPAGPEGPVGQAGRDSTNDGMPIAPSTAGILVFAFVVNIIVAIMVFSQYARQNGWKRPGFGDPKPNQTEHDDHDEFAEIEPEAHAAERAS